MTRMLRVLVVPSIRLPIARLPVAHSGLSARPTSRLVGNRMPKPPSILETEDDNPRGIRKAILDTLEANCGVCRAEHLVQRGEYHGFTVGELRKAGVGLGVVGITVDGIRYVALPSHKDKLRPWAEYHASVMRYHRSDDEKNAALDFIELDDDIPAY